MFVKLKISNDNYADEGAHIKMSKASKKADIVEAGDIVTTSFDDGCQYIGIVYSRPSGELFVMYSDGDSKPLNIEILGASFFFRRRALT